MDLQNKRALVTGGTKGIGAASAIELARRGCDVAINGRHDDEEAAQTKKTIESLGRRCEIVVADVALPEQATECVAQVAERLGGVEILVHSAGGLTVGNIFDVTPEQWKETFDIHVHAVYHLCRAAIPHMQAAKEGAILLISSAAGIRGCSGVLCYQVVKGALPQFVRALARDHADDNIRVNAVAPGVIRTRFHSYMSEEAKQHNIDHRIPLHCEGTSEDVATLITELVANPYITGETVTIDGGLTMRMA